VYEFVLIFSDGTTCISLHHEFEPKLKDLYLSIPAYKKHSQRNWQFFRSCGCDELPTVRINISCNEVQCAQENAKYYNHRGRFILRRGFLLQNENCAELARKYLNEAWRLDRRNREYQDDYEMALVADRQEKLDPELEEWIAGGVDLGRIPSNSEDERHRFRVEYIQRVEMAGRFQELEARLNRLRGNMVRNARQLVMLSQWSYDEERERDSQGMTELDHSRSRNVIELPGSPV
jgi:hypothetical protein